MQVTFDQKIQIWNTVGTWVAGIATFAAVCVSLYLARRAERVRLDFRVFLMLLIQGNGAPTAEYIVFSVTNLGERPITISGVSWKLPNLVKRTRALQQFPGGTWGQQPPIELQHGKKADFVIPLDDPDDWTPYFCGTYLKNLRDWQVKMLRAVASTTVGQTVSARPGKDIFERIFEVRRSRSFRH